MIEDAKNHVSKNPTVTKQESIDNDPTSPTDSLIDVIQHDQSKNKSPSILTLNSTKLIPSFRLIDHCTGIIYTLIASFLFTASGFIVKQLRVDLFDALLVRFSFQLFIFLAYLLYKRTPFIQGSTKLILLQIVRAIIASSGILLFYASYRFIPLPDLTTCRYTQVAWTAIIAMIILRERISLVTVLAIICTLVGVIFVAQPTFIFPKDPITSNETLSTQFESDNSHRFLGLTLALICALSISLGMVLNKKLMGSKISEILILFQLTVLNFFLVSIYHLYNRFVLHKYAHHTMFTWQFFLAASVSLFQILSSALVQRAVKLEHPSIISVVQSSDILVAIILQNLFTQVRSNVFVLIGSFFVITSIFLVGIHKFWQDGKRLAEEKRDTTINIPCEG